MCVCVCVCVCWLNISKPPSEFRFIETHLTFVGTSLLDKLRLQSKSFF